MATNLKKIGVATMKKTKRYNYYNKIIKTELSLGKLKALGLAPISLNERKAIC